MDILRDHTTQVFRVLAQDLAGWQTLEHISDHLGTRRHPRRHDPAAGLAEDPPAPLRTPKCAVIGYGKLAARSSATPPTSTSSSSTTTITRTRRRTTHGWRNAPTPGVEPDGRGHPLRNRPAPAPERRCGGLLANSVDAFREYELKHAWVWEHQG